MMRPVYMAVTQDKYELPFAVADSMTELAEIVGVDLTTVSHSINAQKKRKLKRRPKYICVWIKAGGRKK